MFVLIAKMYRDDLMRSQSPTVVFKVRRRGSGDLKLFDYFVAQKRYFLPSENISNEISRKLVIRVDLLIYNKKF